MPTLSHLSLQIVVGWLFYLFQIELFTISNELIDELTIFLMGKTHKINLF